MFGNRKHFLIKVNPGAGDNTDSKKAIAKKYEGFFQQCFFTKLYRLFTERSKPVPWLFRVRLS